MVKHSDDVADSPPLRTPETRVSALAIVQHLAAAIERGAYLPKSRLREQEVADLFNCSRAPVREALRILESRGLVIIEPMKGARVAAIDDESFYEVFLIRRALAGLLAEQIARAGDNPRRQKFIGLARGLMPMAEGVADAAAFAAHLADTRAAFSMAADMPRTVQLMQSLTFGRQAFQAEYQSTPRRRLSFARVWNKLADAVVAQDPARAHQAMQRIFDLAYRYVSVMPPSTRDEAAQD